MNIKILYRLTRFVFIVGCFAGNLFAGQGIDSLKQAKYWLKLTVYSGYESNDLGELKSLFNGFVENLSASGINMPRQGVYPYATELGGSVLFSLQRNMYFGIKFEHTDTKAYSLYGDKAGTIDVTSGIKTNKIVFAGQYDIDAGSEYFTPVAEMNLGFLNIDYNFAAKVALTPPLRGNSEEKLTANDYTFMISIFLGLQHSIYRNLILFEKMGYQFADFKGIPVSVNSDGNVRSSSLVNRIDLRGMICQIGLGLQF